MSVSETFAFCCPATFANVHGNEFALACVELFLFTDFPFVEAAFTQGFALMALGGLESFEGKNVRHACSAQIFSVSAVLKMVMIKY